MDVESIQTGILYRKKRHHLLKGNKEMAYGRRRRSRSRRRGRRGRGRRSIRPLRIGYRM